MTRLDDLTGRTFGRLTVIERACHEKGKKPHWICKCECGNYSVVASGNLRTGSTKSCGCLNYEDLTGKRFGRLTVIERDIEKSGNGAFWVCRCDCGNHTTVSTSHLNSGCVVSCGCFAIETRKKANTKHGQEGTRLYRIWNGMKDRCTNPNASGYALYGGRGIKVCDEWSKSFKSFYDWALKSGYQENLTIDRIDVNGNYEPDNCRWATYKEQGNNKRSNRYITVNGETHTVSEWADSLSMKYNTLDERIRKGWSEEEAVSVPVNGVHGNQHGRFYKKVK